MQKSDCSPGLFHTTETRSGQSPHPLIGAIQTIKLSLACFAMVFLKKSNTLCIILRDNKHSRRHTVWQKYLKMNYTSKLLKTQEKLIQNTSCVIDVNKNVSFSKVQWKVLIDCLHCSMDQGSSHYPLAPLFCRKLKCHLLNKASLSPLFIVLPWQN